jgi:hypothetical protein
LCGAGGQIGFFIFGVQCQVCVCHGFDSSVFKRFRVRFVQVRDANIPTVIARQDFIGDNARYFRVQMIIPVVRFRQIFSFKFCHGFQSLKLKKARFAGQVGNSII